MIETEIRIGEKRFYDNKAFEFDLDEIIYYSYQLYQKYEINNR